MPEIIIILHNIRSALNVGSIFRTSEGFGVKQIICSGYTPYPEIVRDPRLPHIRQKIAAQIHKTALGAETIMPFTYQDSPDITTRLKDSGYVIVGLEQTKNSARLSDYTVPKKIALILGEEVGGISPELLRLCDDVIEIPMVGQKESFNVSVAAGIALYDLTKPTE